MVDLAKTWDGSGRAGAVPRKLFLEGPAGRIEAALRLAAPGRAAAVVSHPHPLYGGTLQNPVIFHADRELSRAGFTTLRFNFRGVGRSEGAHDQGAGEAEDVGAAAAWLKRLMPDVPLFLVGFSFGSWCSLRHALGDPAVSAVVAIGLPVSVYDLAGVVAALRRPLAVVQAEHDEYGSPAQVDAVLRAATPPARIFPVLGTSHLFPGMARRAGERVVEAAEFCLSGIASSRHP